MANFTESVWAVDENIVAALLSKELDEQFHPERVTSEMVKRVAQAYFNSFKDYVDDHGISFRGTRAPSEVWDVLEELAKPHHRDDFND